MSKQGKSEREIDGEVIEAARLAERPGDIDAEQFLANQRFVDRAIVRWPAERAENERLRKELAAERAEVDRIRDIAEQMVNELQVARHWRADEYRQTLGEPKR